MPSDRADDIIEFDGSVIIKRTRGELSAECHGEPANFCVESSLRYSEGIKRLRMLEMHIPIYTPKRM